MSITPLTKKRAVKTQLYTEDLAKMMGVRTWDDIIDHYGGYGDEEEEASAYREYANAVESVANKMFEDHGMTLVERKGRRGGFEIAPERTWDAAAAKIIDTINGVGQFEFSNVREFIRSGPYKSARDAVMQHLGWMTRRPDVYGGSSYRDQYYRAVR